MSVCTLHTSCRNIDFAARRRCLKDVLSRANLEQQQVQMKNRRTINIEPFPFVARLPGEGMTILLDVINNLLTIGNNQILRKIHQLVNWPSVFQIDILIRVACFATSRTSRQDTVDKGV